MTERWVFLNRIPSNLYTGFYKKWIKEYIRIVYESRIKTNSFSATYVLLLDASGNDEINMQEKLLASGGGGIIQIKSRLRRCKEILTPLFT